MQQVHSVKSVAQSGNPVDLEVSTLCKQIWAYICALSIIIFIPMSLFKCKKTFYFEEKHALTSKTRYSKEMAHFGICNNNLTLTDLFP